VCGKKADVYKIFINKEFVGNFVYGPGTDPNKYSECPMYEMLESIYYSVPEKQIDQFYPSKKAFFNIYLKSVKKDGKITEHNKDFIKPNERDAKVIQEHRGQ
jgi:hypothetical protein